jgi:uncharacterized protein involved in type VI secretion and phage assembly
MYEGQGTCIGLPGLAAGDYLEIAGVGKRFSGTYRVRKVTHRLDGSGYTTEFAITQRSHSSLMGLLRKQIDEEPSPSRVERFYGVVLAEVEDNHEVADVPPTVPLGRVKVSYPGLSEEFISGWAPVARPMAGDGAGFFALPQKGDQVLVAFEHGDLSKPYVLGALWNVNQSPPAKNLDGQNRLTVIKSRTGHTITFDDSPGGGKLVVESGGSSITLDARDGSVTISARGNLTITAGGTLVLEGARLSPTKTKITMNATQVDVS